MFIHLVLFSIGKKNVAVYKADCLLWEKEAKRYPAFLSYHTLRRTDKAGQYASYYVWKSEASFRRFMKKHHDRLVRLSHSPVKVLGYYNFKTV